MACGTKIPHKKLMPSPTTFAIMFKTLVFGEKVLTNKVRASVNNKNTKLFKIQSKPFLENISAPYTIRPMMIKNPQTARLYLLSAKKYPHLNKCV